MKIKLFKELRNKYEINKNLMIGKGGEGIIYDCKLNEDKDWKYVIKE